MKRCSSGWFGIASASRCAAVIASFALAACHAESSADPVIVIDAATRSFEASADGGEGETRALPDTWSHEERSRHPRAWYRSHFELGEVPQEAWSVYIARADMNAAVSLNGSSLGGIGRISNPPSRLRHTPLLFPIEAKRLRRGTNRLEVELAVEPTSIGALSKVEVGPSAVLARKHAIRHFAQITWIQFAAGMAALLIVVVATVYGPRGRGTSYRWFQFSVLLWILYASEIWILDPPLPARVWEAVANGAQYFSIWAIMLGFHRALGEARPRIEIGVAAALAAAVGLYLIVPAEFIWPLRATIGIGICGIASYMVEFVRNSPAAEEWVLEKHHVAGGAVGLVAGVHDIASGPFGWPFSGYWLVQHAGALAVLFTLAAIVRHLMSSIRDARSLGRDLEVRFAEAERELAERFQRIREIESTRMIEKERQRLTRGLHEGVGSALMSTIASLEAEAPVSRSPRTRVADRIRDALDDLRLVIDSLRPEETLLDMLARLRSRLAARFERRGIAVAWQVTDISPFRGLEAEHALVLLRILQDAFRDIERVPLVRTVVVRTGNEARAAKEGIYVEIEGDGGEAATSVQIEVMRRRAATIGGATTFAANSHTTRIRLWLPLDLPEVSRA